MDLFARMKNIKGIDQTKEIENAIVKVREKLPFLVEERMCKVYNGLLLNELLCLHIPARLINTLDLGIDYEHVFLLIPHKNMTGGGYILADLTFFQFHHDLENEFLKKGYQEIDNIHFNRYLKVVSQKELDFFVSLEEAFYENDEREENTRK